MTPPRQPFASLDAPRLRSLTKSRMNFQNKQSGMSIILCYIHILHVDLTRLIIRCCHHGQEKALGRHRLGEYRPNPQCLVQTQAGLRRGRGKRALQTLSHCLENRRIQPCSSSRLVHSSHSTSAIHAQIRPQPETGRSLASVQGCLLQALCSSIQHQQDPS